MVADSEPTSLEVSSCDHASDPSCDRNPGGWMPGTALLPYPARRTLRMARKPHKCSTVRREFRPSPYMLRLTKKADYGLMALKYLAEQAILSAPSSAAQSAKDIAEAYHIPPQLLAKILQTLTKAGILVSQAGTNGGYALARSAYDISAFEVIRAIDGPLFITSCITIHGTCDLHGHCTIKEPLRKVNDSIKDLLSGIRVSDLVEDAAGTTAHAVAGGLVSIAL